MPDTGLQTATGNGEFLLSSEVTILYLDARVDVATIEVDYRSVLIPRRQLHAGWIATASGTVGVASVDSALSEIAVTWSSYLDFEHILKTLPSNFPYDDRIMWNIPSGISVLFRASW